MKPSKDLDEILADKSGAVSDNQKQAILQWVSETVVGHDEPGVTNIMIAIEHERQREILRKEGINHGQYDYGT